MSAAAGAVAAAVVADQMLGPKEDMHLEIVLVGLPARGKTFTAAKLTRYLRWLGHDTKHFNVGKYRRLKHGANQSADFFRGDNPEGMEARNEVAALAMDDMTAWMQEGGQVGIFDATNSTSERRNMLMKMAEGKCKIIFLETICTDPQIIERNIRLKIQQSPDYAEEPDFEAGYQDFKRRLDYYETDKVMALMRKGAKGGKNEELESKKKRQDKDKETDVDKDKWTDADKDKGTNADKNKRIKTKGQMRIKSKIMHKCYYLDSLKHSTINQQLKQIIDATMLVYTTQSGSDKRINLMWEQVRVPKQPGNTECGYYVCKFMKYIIDNGLDVLVNANIGDGKQIYKDVDLDGIREDWAHYVSNFVLA